MIQMTVNRMPVQVPPESSVLDAVRASGTELPTLCFHDGLAPYGSCRLCMVSVTAPQKKLVAACLHPAEEGLAVETETEEARGARRMVLEFLLSRCPQSDVIQGLAARQGVSKPRFSKVQAAEEDELCILCGLCVRVCREVIGAAAIGFTGRGEQRRVATPFDLQSEACVGCGACAAVCPTGAVRMEDRGDLRILHTFNTRIRLNGCTECGAFFVPEKLDVLKAVFSKVEPLWGLCPQCRRRLALRQTKNIKPGDSHPRR